MYYPYYMNGLFWKILTNEYSHFKGCSTLLWVFHFYHSIIKPNSTVLHATTYYLGNQYYRPKWYKLIKPKSVPCTNINTLISLSFPINLMHPLSRNWKSQRFNPQIKILSVILWLEMSNISYIPTVLLNIHSSFFFNQKCWCPTYHDCYPGYHLSLPSFHNNTGKETCYNNSTLLFLYLTHKNCASCFEMKIAFVTIRAE